MTRTGDDPLVWRAPGLVDESVPGCAPTVGGRIRPPLDVGRMTTLRTPARRLTLTHRRTSGGRRAVGAVRGVKRFDGRRRQSHLGGRRPPKVGDQAVAR